VAFLTDFNLLGYTKLMKIITNNVIIKPNILMVYCFLGCTKVPRSNVGNGLWKSEESGCCPPTEPPLAAKGGAWFRSGLGWKLEVEGMPGGDPNPPVRTCSSMKGPLGMGGGLFPPPGL